MATLTRGQTFTNGEIVTPAKLHALVDSATASNIATADLADNAVTTSKIAAASVTTAKLADANVTTAKLADGNVTTAKIVDANVTTAKIADASVTTTKIVDANVTTSKLADASVTSTKIADANVTDTKLAATLDLSTKILTFPATQALSRPVLAGYRETVAAATGTSGTITIDLNTAGIFTLAPTGNITGWTINNNPPTGSLGSFVVRITGNGTPYTYTWPTTTKWAYGDTPSVTSTSGKVDIFSFFTFDGGTTWFAQPIGQNY